MATPQDDRPDSSARARLKTAWKPRAPHHSVASSHSWGDSIRCSWMKMTWAACSSYGIPSDVHFDLKAVQEFTFIVMISSLL